MFLEVPGQIYIVGWMTGQTVMSNEWQVTDAGIIKVGCGLLLSSDAGVSSFLLSNLLWNVLLIRTLI